MENDICESFRSLECGVEQDHDTLLIAVLADLDDATEATLIQLIQEALESKVKIETWKPTKLLLESIAIQGLYRDSIANLYALAVLAHRSGLSRFLVADELSKRQLTGKSRYFEDENLSVVMMATEQSAPGELRVIARRTDPEHNLNSKILEIFDRIFQITKPVISKNPRRQCECDFHRDLVGLWPVRGLILSDPDRGVLTPNPGSSLEYEKALSTLSTFHNGLPQELVNDIVSRASLGRSDVPSMPVWKRGESKSHLVIFLLFATTTQELNQTYKTIQAAMEKNADADGMTFELIPQSRHHIKSRRQLADFLRVHRLYKRGWVESHWPEGDPPLHFLGQPISSVEPSRQFGAVLAGFETPPVVMPRSLAEIVIESYRWDACTEERLRWHEEHRDRRSPCHSFENLRHPDEPFYFHLKPWEEASNYSADLQEEIVPMLYMTSQLSEEQDQKIRAALVQESEVWVEHNKTEDWFAFVPWNGAEDDARVKDLWAICMEFEENSLRRGSRACQFFYIDILSPDDGHVTAVEVWYEYEYSNHDLLQNMPLPGLRGFKSARVPAREAKAEYEMFQYHHGLERWGLSIYQRPEWPATKAYKAKDRNGDGDEVEDDDDDDDKDDEEADDYEDEDIYRLNADELA